MLNKKTRKVNKTSFSTVFKFTQIEWHKFKQFFIYTSTFNYECNENLCDETNEKFELNFIKRILLRYSNWVPNECTYTVQVYTTMKIIGSIDTTCLTYTWSLWPLFKYIAFIQPVEQKKMNDILQTCQSTNHCPPFHLYFLSHKWWKVIDNFIVKKKVHGFLY